MREKDQEIDIKDLIVETIKEVLTDIGPPAEIEDRAIEMTDLVAEKVTKVVEITATTGKAGEITDPMIKIDTEVILEKMRNTKDTPEVLVKPETITQALSPVLDVEITIYQLNVLLTHFIKENLAQSANSNMKQENTNKDHKVGTGMEEILVVQSLRDQKTGLIRNLMSINLNILQILSTETVVTLFSLPKCTPWEIHQKIIYLQKIK